MAESEPSTEPTGQWATQPIHVEEPEPSTEPTGQWATQPIHVEEPEPSTEPLMTEPTAAPAEPEPSTDPRGGYGCYIRESLNTSPKALSVICAQIMHWSLAPFSFLVNDTSEKIEESRIEFEESYLEGQDLSLSEKYERALLRMRSLKMGAFLQQCTLTDEKAERDALVKQVAAQKDALDEHAAQRDALVKQVAAQKHALDKHAAQRNALVKQVAAQKHAAQRSRKRSKFTLGVADLGRRVSAPGIVLGPEVLLLR